MQHSIETNALTVPVGVLANAFRAAHRDGLPPYAPLPAGPAFCSLAACGSHDPARLASRVADMRSRLDLGDFDLSGASAIAAAAVEAPRAAAVAAPAPAPAPTRSPEDSRAATRAYNSQKYRVYYDSEAKILEGVAMGVLPAQAAAAMMQAVSAAAAEGGGGGGGGQRQGRPGLGAR